MRQYKTIYTFAVCAGALALVTLGITNSVAAGGQQQALVRLQSSSPGTQQNGNTNISGTGVFGGDLKVTGKISAGSLSVQSDLSITSSNPGTCVIEGINTNATNSSYGVCGHNTATSGNQSGVYGTSNASNPNGVGVTGTAGSGTGVIGNGVVGVLGNGGYLGVQGVSTSNNGNGVGGYANNGPQAWGVTGASSSGVGVNGRISSAGNNIPPLTATAGVSGVPTGIGLYGETFALSSGYGAQILGRSLFRADASPPFTGLLTGGEAIRVQYANGAASAATTGINVVATPFSGGKGGQTGVQATASNNYTGVNTGSALGRLASSSGFDANGTNIGAYGASTPGNVTNFGAQNISYEMGGTFFGNLNSAIVQTPSTGKNWLGGSYGEINGSVATSIPVGNGAYAGVIGVDLATGPAQHWAGFFQGVVNSTGGYMSISDMRLKENVETLTNPLGLIQKLRGVSFDYRKDLPDNMKGQGGRQIGFIAQEVKEVLPFLVAGNDDSFYSVNYAGVTPLLVEAIKQQQKQINDMRAENEALKAELKEFRAFMSEMRARTSN